MDEISDMPLILSRSQYNTLHDSFRISRLRTGIPPSTDGLTFEILKNLDWIQTEELLARTLLCKIDLVRGNIFQYASFQKASPFISILTV